MEFLMTNYLSPLSLNCDKYYTEFHSKGFSRSKDINNSFKPIKI